MSKLLAQVLARTGQPRKMKSSPGREADLTKRGLHAKTTGTGFTSKTPDGGAGSDRGGKPRPWPRKSLEQRESASDDLEG